MPGAYTVGPRLTLGYRAELRRGFPKRVGRACRSGIRQSGPAMLTQPKCAILTLHRVTPGQSLFWT